MSSTQKTFLAALSLLMMPVAAWAEGAQPQGGITPFIPLIFIFAIIYFLILRPQQKKAQLHSQFLKELKKGDVVVTTAGIIGTIRQLSERFVTLEVDDGVCLKLVRNQVAEGAGSLKDENPKNSKDKNKKA